MTPAKLLLFGEHTVLHGGEALAVPLWKFGAKWIETGACAAAMPFEKWAAFAKTQDALADWFDVASFSLAAPRLAVTSTIPQNYGLGSSGALTAMVYERFTRSRAQTDDLSALRARLGQLESFFHGRSSGLDPLVCYLKRPVHVLSNGGVAALATDAVNLDKWFLLDSARPKAGKAAIARFGVSCKEEGFRQNYLAPALALNAGLIAGFEPQPSTEWLQKLRELSSLQLAHLGWLVPEPVREQWKKYLAQDSAYLKLCGAGGGGYFLGYAVGEPVAQAIHLL